MLCLCKAAFTLPVANSLPPHCTGKSLQLVNSNELGSNLLIQIIYNYASDPLCSIHMPQQLFYCRFDAFDKLKITIYILHLVPGRCLIRYL